MPIQKYSEEAIAKNFCVYRLAVTNYIQENSNVVSISDNALGTPRDGFIRSVIGEPESAMDIAIFMGKQHQKKLFLSEKTWAILF